MAHYTRAYYWHAALGFSSSILWFSDEGKEGAVVLVVDLFPTMMAHDLISLTMTHHEWSKGYDL